MNSHSGWNWQHIIGHLLNCFLDCFLINKKQLDYGFCLSQHGKQLCSIRNGCPFADQTVSTPLPPTPSGAPFPWLTSKKFHVPVVNPRLKSSVQSMKKSPTVYLECIGPHCKNGSWRPLDVHFAHNRALVTKAARLLVGPSVLRETVQKDIRWEKVCT